MENMEPEQSILCNQENLPLVGQGQKPRSKTFDLYFLKDVLEQWWLSAYRRDKPMIGLNSAYWVPFSNFDIVISTKSVMVYSVAIPQVPAIL